MATSAQRSASGDVQTAPRKSASPNWRVPRATYVPFTRRIAWIEPPDDPSTTASRQVEPSAESRTRASPASPVPVDSREPAAISPGPPGRRTCSDSLGKLARSTHPCNAAELPGLGAGEGAADAAGEASGLGRKLDEAIDEAIGEAVAGVGPDGSAGEGVVPAAELHPARTTTARTALSWLCTSRTRAGSGH